MYNMYSNVFNLSHFNISTDRENSTQETTYDFIVLPIICIFIFFLHGNFKIHKSECSKGKHIFRTQLKIIITLLLIIFTPILLLFLSICCLYKHIISLKLKRKIGTKYKGIVEGSDTFWLLEDDSKSVINILLFIKHSPRNDKCTLLTMLREQIEVLLKEKQEYEKLSYVAHKYKGYSYFAQENIKIENCIRPLDSDKYKNLETLEATLNSFGSLGLHENNLFLWEILVGDEEIKWDHKKNQVPVVARFHHSVGDGIALINLLIACLEKQKKPESRSMQDDDDFVQKGVRLTIRLMHFVFIIINIPEYLLKFCYNFFNEQNVTHHKKLSGKKIFAWKMEDKPFYVKAVKGIKNRIIGSSFFEVLTAALTASLAEFYQSLDPNVKGVSTLIPVRPHNYSKSVENSSSPLTNAFSVGTFDIPIKNTRCLKYNIVDRLKDVNQHLFKLKKSSEFQVNYWFLHLVVSVVPEQLLLPMMKYFRNTLVLSVLPGPKKIQLMGKYPIEDIVFWVPHKGLTGFGISILTYDDRFQIGISIDEAYGIPKQKLDSVLNNVFKHLDYLEYESFCF